MWLMSAVLAQPWSLALFPLCKSFPEPRVNGPRLLSIYCVPGIVSGTVIDTISTSVTVKLSFSALPSHVINEPQKYMHKSIGWTLWSS